MELGQLDLGYSTRELIRARTLVKNTPEEIVPPHGTEPWQHQHALRVQV